jgi:hypothetical protein
MVTTAPEAWRYDEDKDVLLVRFSNKMLAWSDPLDADRAVYYAEDGTPLAVELRGARMAVDLEGLPWPETVADVVNRLRYDRGPVALLRRASVGRTAQRRRGRAGDRHLATRAARRLRDAGIRSVEELYAMHRYDLLKVPGLGPRAFDYINDALNRGDAHRLHGLFS